MRIPLRTSRWAIWARRVASIALPIELIAVIMHRQRMLTSETFTYVFGAGLALAILAVILSFIAFVRLWQSGFRGWGKSFQALFLGLILAAPIGLGIYWASLFPQTSDVATDGTLPSLDIAPPSRAGVLSRAETLEAFPNAVARTYPLSPDKVFALAADLVARRQWEVRIRRQPVAPAYAGRLHALAMTWIGYRDEVAILVDWAGTGAVVSMRSASLYGIGDLGTNGRRIEAFLSDLDQAVTEAQREEPILENPAPAEKSPQ